MDKVLRTTYRKLYKMSSRVDGSTAMRSILSCAPQRVYNHRRGDWVSLNVAKLSSWVESRIFLDNVIRRLNNGRQFFIPPTTEAERKAAEEKMSRLRAELEATPTPSATPSAAAGTSSTADAGAEKPCSKSSTTASAAVVAAAAAGAASAAAASATGKPSSSSSSPQSPGAALVSLDVVPYAPFRATLRLLFETTPFSIGNLNNGFAAVKELSYVCEVTDKNAALVVKLPEELKALPWPTLTRVLEVDPIHHVLLIKGLTEEIMESLHLSHRVRQRKAARAKAAAAAASQQEPKNAFEEDAEATATAAATAEEDEELEGMDADEDEDVKGEFGDVDEDVEVLGGASPFSVASTAALADAEAAAATVPKHVQLLLAHPQLSGFFRHSVLLVVRNAENEAAGFILNKPLENDEGLRMPVNATIRLNRVHPIFSKFLRDHTIMVGGPVMVGGAFDESVFLLHSVPDVASALPLGEGLWLDGDLDQLMAKLQSGEARPEQVTVICGFSGWGVEQIKGEVDAGTWIVASGDAADKAVTGFVMQLAHVSGAHAAPMDSLTATTTTAAAADVEAGRKTETQSEEEEEEEDTAEAVAQEANTHPSRLSVRISANRRATASWVWAYEVLGSPLSDLAANQKPETTAEFSE